MGEVLAHVRELAPDQHRRHRVVPEAVGKALERAVEHEHVGALARLERARLLGEPQHPGGLQRAGEQRLGRREAVAARRPADDQPARRHRRGPGTEVRPEHAGRPRIGPVALYGLLFTIVLLFALIPLRLADPRPLKAGTRLRAIAWYDNSKNNPHNPDPTKTVTWGDQTSDEMMVGFFDVAIPAGMDKEQFFVRHGQEKLNVQPSIQQK